MKKFIFPFVFLAMTAQVWAQAPQSMSYQAVIRNAANSPMITSPIGMHRGELDMYFTERGYDLFI